MIDRNKISYIIEEVLVSCIADKVVEKIIGMNKDAIVLFTGASIGFNQSIKSLNKLKDEGWKLTAVLSRGAEAVLSEKLIKDLLHLDTVIAESSEESFMNILNKSNIVLIPALTINTAAKIAYCIQDNLVTNIVAHSLMAGKTVIAAEDGCCPYNETRKSLGFKVTEAYKKTLNNNLNTLADYGIQLTASDKLAEAATVALVRKFQNTGDHNSKGGNEKKNVVKINDTVISRGCILNNSNFSVIKAGKAAVITDLAREEAAKLKIEIIKE